MAYVTLTYKEQIIAELNGRGNVTIKTAGRYCDANIELSYIGGGGGDEPALPLEYQRVEYLDFTPSIGIVITLPAEDYVLYDAYGLSTKESGDKSDLFGYRAYDSHSKDFECGFKTNGHRLSFIRTPGNNNGIAILDDSSYTIGERAHAYILLNSPRSTALIGKYADYSSSGVDDLAFKGKFYSLKGTNIVSNSIAAWFVPCYRKSDNQVGVYDHIAHAFYYETYSVGSGYSITAGPDVN